MTGLNAIDATASEAAANAGMEGEMGNAAQTCPDATLEVGVFFDGTLNNRFNVLSRARSDASYQNALSNPALLFPFYKNDPIYNERNACGGIGRAFRSIYVQGPGSTAGREDDQTGYAFGMGRQSGVESRVLWGFQQLLARIRGMGGAPHLNKVIVDVFGFSRGAAAARYFVNCIRARRIRYDPYGRGDYTETLPDDLEVEIRFIGIFDTVAAIGDPADEDNDPVNMHVKTAQVTGRIYHLTAGDEIRRNFRLNRNVPGGGDTLELPGAHSDVGGGYRGAGDVAELDSVSRRSFPTRRAAEAAQAATRRADLAPRANAADEAVFVREGWMNASEPTGGIVRHMTPIRAVRVMVGGPGVPRLITRYAYDEQRALHRPWVQIGLSRIALHMMHEAAVAEVDGAFLPLPAEQPEYVIPAGLRSYESAIRSGTLSGAARATVLRNYGHVSMKDGPVLSSNYQGHRAQRGRRRVEYRNRPGRAI